MDKNPKIVTEAPCIEHGRLVGLCSVCRELGTEAQAVIEINGNVNCYYCGNAVSLCLEHVVQMIREMTAIGELRGLRWNN